MILQTIAGYVEKNLTGKIDYDELARECATNKFNVMRIFSALTDFTLAEYVRARKLSEAGRALCETDDSVIDIGFKYGYTTPESFTKAFKAFNGFTPRDCRKNKKHKVVPAIAVSDCEENSPEKDKADNTVVRDCPKSYTGRRNVEETAMTKKSEMTKITIIAGLPDEKDENCKVGTAETQTENGRNGKFCKYEAVEIREMLLVGFKKRFLGKVEKRKNSDEKFITTTRRVQEALRAIRKDDDCDWWEVLNGFDETGYDCACTVQPRGGVFYRKKDGKFSLSSGKNRVASSKNFATECEKVENSGDAEKGADWQKLAAKTQNSDYDYSFTAEELKKIVGRLKRFVANGKYAKFVSENKDFPMVMLDSFTKSVYETIEKDGLLRDETRAELLKIHWTKRAKISERHLELFIPIK